MLKFEKFAIYVFLNFVNFEHSVAMVEQGPFEEAVFVLPAKVSNVYTYHLYCKNELHSSIFDASKEMKSYSVMIYKQINNNSEMSNFLFCKCHAFEELFLLIYPKFLKAMNTSNFEHLTFVNYFDSENLHWFKDNNENVIPSNNEKNMGGYYRLTASSSGHMCKKTRL